MTEPNIHKTEQSRENIRVNGTYSFADQLNLNTPLDRIRHWYDSQTDKDVITEFTGMISFFHPDQTMELEVKLNRKIQKFRSYLILPENQRCEIARRALSLIGHIDLVIETKNSEEKNLGIPDTINYHWSIWSQEWTKLRKSTLMSEKIKDWFFLAKPL